MTDRKSNPDKTGHVHGAAHEHRKAAEGSSTTCAVLTVSDTRTKATDKSGRLLSEALEAAGHEIGAYEIVPDEADLIKAQLRVWLQERHIGLIVTTGGSGIARRDTTIEVVERILDKRLDGFGELFRMLSWDEIGSAAMLSRAVGGLAGDTLVFALPGSSNAVRLAVDRLIVPELAHLLWLRKSS